MKKTNNQDALTFTIEARATDEMISAFDSFAKACEKVGKSLSDVKADASNPKIDADTVYDFYHWSRPDITFEIGREPMHQIGRLKDEHGIYLCEPPYRDRVDYTLMGHKVVIVDEPTISIRYTFPCGSSHVVKFTG